MGCLLHVTDLHLCADEGARLRGVQPLASLRRTLEQALALTRARGSPRMPSWSPAMWSMTIQAVALFRRIHPAGVPVCCIPGNHDQPAAMARALAAPPFVCGGHLDLPGWRVVQLDSTVPGQDGGHLAPAQLQLLERALASAATPVLVCLHHHPVPMASDWLDRIGLDNAAQFFDILDAHPGVRGVVWGHVHQAYDAQRHGVRLLATPSTCAQFLPHSHDFAVDSRPPAYRTLELTPDGALDTELHWVDSCGGGSSHSASSAA